MNTREGRSPCPSQTGKGARASITEFASRVNTTDITSYCFWIVRTHSRHFGPRTCRLLARACHSDLVKKIHRVGRQFAQWRRPADEHELCVRAGNRRSACDGIAHIVELHFERPVLRDGRPSTAAAAACRMPPATGRGRRTGSLAARQRRHRPNAPRTQPEGGYVSGRISPPRTRMARLPNLSFTVERYGSDSFLADSD